MNLSEYVLPNKAFDFENFNQDVQIAVGALNDVLDEGQPLHPLQEQKDSVHDWRQIGLGIMGIADMLIKMEIPYDSDEAIAICDQIGYELLNAALHKSAMLAKEFGTYPKYDAKYAINNFVVSNCEGSVVDEIEAYGLRNSQLLTIAPTGTLSTMLGISGGIEPIYANYYNRKTESLHGKEVVYKVYTPIVDKYMKEHSLTEEEELPAWFVTSSTINPMKRIDMQATWQQYIDASISSTVNLPYEATTELIGQLYFKAWEKGLKGLTIFRDGCKRLGILTTSNTTDTGENLPRGSIVQCSDDLVGKKRKLVSGCGSLHCLAYFHPVTGELQEVYLNKGSTGGCVDADTEYFNGHEWKKISEYDVNSDEKVLQYNEDGTANLAKPVNYIVNDNVEYLKHFTNTIGMDMVLSEDHRMYLYKNYRKYSMGIRSKLASEIVTVGEYLNREGGKERHVPTTFKYNAIGVPLNDDIIRLLVAVYADGSYDGHKISVTLKKDRKKKRLHELLAKCDIGYSRRDIKNTDYTKFCFYPIPSIVEWFTDKRFTDKWYDCNDHQLEIVTDECVYWDGSVGQGNRLGEYFTSKKEEATFMQFALTRLGYRATIGLNNGTACKEDSYRIRWTKQNVHNLKFAHIEDYKTKDNHSYCFTVPSGLLVLRRNNQIFVTGNCANFMVGLSRTLSLLCRAGVSVYDIKDQLDSTGVCPSYARRSATKHDTSKGSCCPMAVGNALIDMYEEMQKELGNKKPKIKADVTLIPPKAKIKIGKTELETDIDISKMSEQEAIDNGKCPICGEPLQYVGGCVQCTCGWSRCG